MQTLRNRVVAVIAATLSLSAAGCRNHAAPAFGQYPENDPANANMAPVQHASQPVQRPGVQPYQGQPARVLGQRETGSYPQSGEQYPEQYADQNPQQNPQQYAYDDAGQEADQAPPPLPDYQQPAVTRANTIWTPGYWAHAPTGYYWVPGAYVNPPYVGALWTPGYWGADGPRYRFHRGYWGRHIGFYGGVPYGGGYVGTGYRGGYWNGNRFYYNQAVNPVDINLIPTVYDQPEAMPSYRSSFNGPGGISLLPIAAELIALHERHERGVRFQYDVERQAALNRNQFYEYNHGRPENYYAGDSYVVTRGPEFERREGFGPVGEEHGRGNAYGHFKEHGNPHDEDRGDRGDHGDHGEGHGRGGGEKRHRD